MYTKEEKENKSLVQKMSSILNSLRFSFIMSWESSKGLFILRILFEIIQALVPIYTLYIGGYVINELSNILMLKREFSEGLGIVLSILFYIFVIQIFSSIIQTANDICISIHRDIISNYINIQVNKKLSELDISFFDSPKLYDELINVRRDSQALQTLTWFAVAVIRCIVQLIASIFMLINVHWIFPVLLVVLNLPAIMVEKKFAEHIYMWTRGRAPEERKMNYLQTIMTIREFAKDIRLFGIFNFLIERYTLIWNKWFKEKRELTLSRGKWAVLASMLPMFCIITLNIYIVIKIALGEMQIGDYLRYPGIASQLAAGVASLVSSLSQMYDNEIKISHYSEFLKWKPFVDMCGKLERPKNPEIEFVDVYFKYPNTDKYILKGVSFKIGYGEKIALVGLNGAGKSTIIKLLLRFYDVTKGKILINGIDIREYDLNELRKSFGVLFQDFSNYAFTLRENISISDLENVDDEQRMIESLILSGADKIAGRFKKGLDTHLTKQFDINGEELSGGEWQKVAIARAFFRKGDVIVLDEPTAALDPEAEYKVFQQIYELCSGKTSFFISHRLSSVTMADRIIVLEDGKIIENGSHKELLAQNGRYAYLFNMQAERYLEQEEPSKNDEGLDELGVDSKNEKYKEKEAEILKLIKKKDDSAGILLDKKYDLKQKDKNKIFAYAFAVALVLIGTGIGLTNIQSIFTGVCRNIFGNGVYVIDSFAGKSAVDVRRILEEKNIEVFEECIDNDIIPKGYVVSQEPEPGEKIKAQQGSKVRLIVSNGPKMITIPDFKNKEMQEAKEFFTNENMSFEVVEIDSNEADNGKVIRTIPDCGENVTRTNNKVIIITSKNIIGTKIFTPNLIGKTLEEAEKIVMEAKLQLSKANQEGVSKKNIIIGQNPAPGMETEFGTEIELYFAEE